MIAIGLLFLRMLGDCCKSRPRLEAEILILRHQLNVLRPCAPRRGLQLRWFDRALFIWLYRRCPRILDAITIVRLETVVRWHRKGFAASWRWRSRRTFVLHFDPSRGMLSEASVVEGRPYSCPRHVAFHPTRPLMWILNEIICTGRSEPALAVPLAGGHGGIEHTHSSGP